MATRIENSRTAKRAQGTMLWDVSDGAFTGTGKVMRLNMRSFPSKNGADITAVTYASQA